MHVHLHSITPMTCGSGFVVVWVVGRRGAHGRAGMLMAEESKVMVEPRATRRTP